MKRFCYIMLYVALLTCAHRAYAQAARKCLRNDEAEYPPIAAKMNLHGTVKIKIWITLDGTVSRLEYIGGHPLLAESALKAVKGWKYQPAAKESTEVVEVKF